MDPKQRAQLESKCFDVQRLTFELHALLKRHEDYLAVPVPRATLAAAIEKLQFFVGFGIGSLPYEPPPPSAPDDN